MITFVASKTNLSKNSSWMVLLSAMHQNVIILMISCVSFSMVLPYVVI